MIVEKLESLNTNITRKIFLFSLFMFLLTGSFILKFEYSPYSVSAYNFINLIFVISAFISILFGKLYFKKLVNEK